MDLIAAVILAYERTCSGTRHVVKFQLQLISGVEQSNGDCDGIVSCSLGSSSSSSIAQGTSKLSAGLPCLNRRSVRHFAITGSMQFWTLTVNLLGRIAIWTDGIKLINVTRS